MTKIIIDNRSKLQEQNINLESVLISLLDLTEATTLKGGTEVADNPARMQSLTEIVEMAGWIADKEDEALNNKILGKKAESLYEEVNRGLDGLGFGLADVIRILKELQQSVTLDKQGEIVPENAIRLKATKLLAKIGKWKKGRKTVQINMSVTQFLTGNDTLSLN